MQHRRHPNRRLTVASAIPGLNTATRKEVARVADRLDETVHNLSHLGAMPSPLPMDEVPVDMQPRKVKEYQDYRAGGQAGGSLDINDLLLRIALATEMIASTFVLHRGLFGRAIFLGTTSTLVVRAEYLRGYIFLNPTTGSIGVTTTSAVLPSTSVVADGNTQATPVVVSGFRNTHFFIDVTAIGAGTTLEVFQQAFDPGSGTWFDIQQLASVTATGETYVNVSTQGITTDMAIRWTVAGGPATATFSATAILKDGTPSAGGAGAAGTVYLGSGGVTTSSGFPLLPGQSRQFFLKENIELFGVAAVDNTEMRIFEL